MTCSVPVGIYSEFGDGLRALRKHAAAVVPIKGDKPYTSRLAQIPFNLGEYDIDADGRDDWFGFTHEFADIFTARRGCTAYALEGVTRGWNGLLNGGPITLFEKLPAASLAAIEQAAHFEPTVPCGGPPAGRDLRRGNLPVFTLNRIRGAACPSGTVPTRLVLTNAGCRATGGIIPERNLGAQCPAISNGSNPINAVTGNKYQREVDYAGTQRGLLRFERHYNSQSVISGSLGPRWSHTYERSLVRHCVSSALTRVCSIRAYRDDGRVITFTSRNGRWASDATVNDTLRELAAEQYELRTVDGLRERYQLAGGATSTRTSFQLAAITDPAGIGVSLEYDGTGRLQRIVAPGSRALSLSYDHRGRLAGFADAASAPYRYTYDAFDNLRSVTYPPATPSDSLGPQRSYVYEDLHDPSALTGIVDELGQRYATWRYDELGRAISSEHAGGVDRVTFEYLPSYTAVTDARGQTRSFNVALEAGVGLITAVTGPNCTTCGPDYRVATRYDERGFKFIGTDANGVNTRYSHTEDGRLTERVEAIGTEVARTTTQTFEPAIGLLSSIELTDAGGKPTRRTNLSYWRGLLKQREDVDLLEADAARNVRRTTYTYYGEGTDVSPLALHGLVKRIDGPRTDVDDHTDFDYDEATGNLSRITNALGHVWQFKSHDAHGRALQVVDPNGVQTTLRFHPRGWLLSRQIDQALTTYSYDPAGQLLRVAQPFGSVVNYAYDAAHRLIAVSDDNGNAISYTLDAQGNRVREQVRGAGTTVLRQFERDYDSYNRLVVTRGGEGQITRYAYDANGRPIQITRSGPSSGNDVARTEVIVYDALGRESQRIDALGGIRSAAYGVHDEQALFTDAAGVMTRQLHSGYGDLVRRESPDSGRARYRFDAAGNRIGETDADDRETLHTYDALNRLTSTTYPDSTTASYLYDEATGGRYARGRLTSRIDASGTTRYQYDSHGKITRTERAFSGQRYVTSYGYTVAGQLATMTYPSGRRVAYTHDNHGRIASIMTASPGQPWQVVIDDIRYQPFGPLRALRYGNGVRMTRTYDRDYRLNALRYDKIFARVYQYDAFDNIVAVHRPDFPGLNERYDYDVHSRLTAARGPWGEWAWTYDANGNRLSAHTAGAVEQYRYLTGSNRLDAIHDASGGLLADYDTTASGSVSQVDGYRLDYGGDGRLAQMHNPRGQFDYRLIHDATGNLVTDHSVEQSAPGTVEIRRQYHEDEFDRLIEVDMQSMSSPSFVGSTSYSMDEMLYLDDLPVARAFNRQLMFLHPDHLGTPAGASDKNGRAQSVEPLPPFIGASPPFLHRLTGLAYPGQRLLRATLAVAHNGWREYDGRSGRYLQPDRLGLAGGDNPYVYAENNPVRWSDPSGLAIWLCSRTASGMPGNHAYLWDDRGEGRSCGRALSSGHAPGDGTGPTGGAESGPPTDNCTRVAESEGWEDSIMDCCIRNANNRVWLPFINDCQNAVRRCVEGIIVAPPPIPDGRFGSSCNRC